MPDQPKHACVGQKKSIGQLLAVAGGGWGLPSGIGNNVRSRVPISGMPDTGAMSGPIPSQARVGLLPSLSFNLSSLISVISVLQVKVNEDPTAALIRELQEELAKMKQSVLTGDVDTLQQIMGTDQPISAANMAAKTQELETVIEQIAALEQKEQEEEVLFVPASVRPCKRGFMCVHLSENEMASELGVGSQGSALFGLQWVRAQVANHVKGLLDQWRA